MMLEIKNVTFGYNRKKPVFENYSLSLNEGNVYGLLGKNGVGKSTLLYIMTGLLCPAQGEVLYQGVNVSLRQPDVLGQMFIVPEEFSLPKITFRQYVQLNRPFYPRFSDELLSSCLRDFDMNVDIHLGELSMGQKKKAYMCFALAANTQLLVMDEPSNGLDIPSKSQFRRVVASGMAEDKSIVISTHQVRDVDSLLDHVVIIDNSRTLLDSSVSAICSRLQFAERSRGELTGDEIFTQPSVQGQSVLLPNRSGEEESNVNLELLFNATLAHPERMAQVFGE